MTTVRTINVELTSDEAKYILHALKEFKESCSAKVKKDEEGDDDLTHMYANDVMQARMIHQKIFDIATPAFSEESLVVSYELL
ncbi:hypothetical protein [Aliikangiella sp. IMCC44359]|uniref:hypothetical protein n=1 Tax=Aliikangiella sp. IMCC44359 TaxID=3459125 RepID=UPI00403AC9D2